MNAAEKMEFINFVLKSGILTADEAKFLIFNSDIWGRQDINANPNGFAQEIGYVLLMMNDINSYEFVESVLP